MSRKDRNFIKDAVIRNTLTVVAPAAKIVKMPILHTSTEPQVKQKPISDQYNLKAFVYFDKKHRQGGVSFHRNNTYLY